MLKRILKVVGIVTTAYKSADIIEGQKSITKKGNVVAPTIGIGVFVSSDKFSIRKNAKLFVSYSLYDQNMNSVGKGLVLASNNTDKDKLNYIIVPANGYLKIVGPDNYDGDFILDIKELANSNLNEDKKHPIAEPILLDHSIIDFNISNKIDQEISIFSKAESAIVTHETHPITDLNVNSQVSNYQKSSISTDYSIKDAKKTSIQSSHIGLPVTSEKINEKDESQEVVFIHRNLTALKTKTLPAKKNPLPTFPESFPVMFISKIEEFFEDDDENGENNQNGENEDNNGNYDTYRRSGGFRSFLKSVFDRLIRGLDDYPSDNGDDGESFGDGPFDGYGGGGGSDDGYGGTSDGYDDGYDDGNDGSTDGTGGGMDGSDDGSMDSFDGYDDGYEGDDTGYDGGDNTNPDIAISPEDPYEPTPPDPTNDIEKEFIRLLRAGQYSSAINLIISTYGFVTANSTYKFDHIGKLFVTDGSYNSTQTITISLDMLNYFLTGYCTFGTIVRMLGHEYVHVAQRTSEPPMTDLNQREFLAYVYSLTVSSLPPENNYQKVYWKDQLTFYYNHLSTTLKATYLSLYNSAMAA